MDSLPLTRRAMLGAGAALGAAAATAGLPGAAGAAAPMQGATQPTHTRFSIGRFEVTTILDGAVPVPGPHPIFGENVSAEAVAALAGENFLPADRMEIPFSVTLVNTGESLILFDTGNGGDTGRRPKAGLLLERLAGLGIAAEQIDTVVITHFHGDHIGGLTEAGAPAFPNAGYVFGAREFDWWSDEDLLFDDAMSTRAQLVQDKVVRFAEKARMIAPGEAVVPGIEAVQAFGHTPGHLAFHLESEGARLMLIADTANHYVASMQRPDWHVRFDMDKEMAVAARKAVLGQIAADRIPFVGYHMPAPAVGYLEARDGGFHYVPASYQLRV
ncbi:MBL fold metallo-hydrolase [Paralimibaculum aggregatum]|uniref:MBL fold metallo-hydrolase n=1 Tax=Paralimibaculum aggregatum TaxID=3036245 RepID=A0ABQ6LKN9_9RHOB|nr:MBL fold metallo-hydrolase [Limibaculum sp. NKW23]GMG82809.1 MBL fold metallo-hydrolase [Limibaculum sp. NKW23]